MTRYRFTCCFTSSVAVCRSNSTSPVSSSSSAECTMCAHERSVSAVRLVEGSTLSPLRPSGPQLVQIRCDS